jgi:hypothetical protein
LAGLQFFCDTKNEINEINQLSEFCEKIDAISEKIETFKNKKDVNGKIFTLEKPNFDSEFKLDEIEDGPSLVLLDQKEDDLTAWTQNNHWTHQDFELCT